MSRRGSTLVAAGILLSRLFGFARLRAMGHFLGAGPLKDAYDAAFRIPNLLQNLFGEGVLSASFIPVYSRLLAEGKEEEAGRVAGAMAGLLAVTAAALSLLGALLAEPLTYLLAPGYGDDVRELTALMVRIAFPATGFLVLSAWCLGVLNSHRRFFLSYVAPVLWNSAQIAVLVGLGLAGVGATSLVVALAWGTLVGSALQMAVQVPSVVRLLGGLRVSLDLGLDGVRRILRALGPVIAGRGVVQLMGYVELVLASFLAVGAVAALLFAQPLYMVPISLFGMAVAASELPELSGLGDDRVGDADERVRQGMARIAFFVVPTALGFVVLGEVVVGALYQSGAFGVEATRQVWLILAAFSLGLLPTTSSRLLQSSLYARGQTKLPALYAAVRVVVAAAIGAALMLQFEQFGVAADGTVALRGELPSWEIRPQELRDVEGQHRLGPVGLALGAGLSAWVELALLRRAVRREAGYAPRLGGGTLGRVAAAAALAVAVGLGVQLLIRDWPPLAAAPLVLGAAGLVYVVSARTLGLRELPGWRDLRPPGGPPTTGGDGSTAP